jgi:hypothetical protein
MYVNLPLAWRHHKKEYNSKAKKGRREGRDQQRIHDIF